MKVTYKTVRESKEVNAYITQGNQALGELGYTEHSQKHAALVAKNAGRILEELNYSKNEVELAKIAGYMHDIGNCVNRSDHAHSGAVLAASILKEMGMNFNNIALVMNAIGVHDESTGGAVNPVSAALILADKADVRRNRVRNTQIASFDKHDRVNYAVLEAELKIQPEKKVILLDIKLDEEICSMMDYFEIFMKRMLMCKRACEILGMKFKMMANDNKIC